MLPYIHPVAHLWHIKYITLAATPGEKRPEIQTSMYLKNPILKYSLVLQTSTPKYLPALLLNNAGHSRKYNLALYFLIAHRTLDENKYLS